MTTDFVAERDSITEEMESARKDLEEVVGRLASSDFLRARRGGWSVARVVQHIIESERSYAALVSRLRGAGPPDFAPARTDISSAAGALLGMASSRASLLSALAGVDEEAFYRLERAGHEEYSVVSVLENVVSHDREHGGQIAAILAAH
jgi:hypothetical protein